MNKSFLFFFFFFFQAEDGIRDFCLSRGLGDVYKRQIPMRASMRHLSLSVFPMRECTWSTTDWWRLLIGRDEHRFYQRCTRTSLGANVLHALTSALDSALRSSMLALRARSAVELRAAPARRASCEDHR